MLLMRPDPRGAQRPYYPSSNTEPTDGDLERRRPYDQTTAPYSPATSSGAAASSSLSSSSRRGAFPRPSLNRLPTLPSISSQLLPPQSLPSSEGFGSSSSRSARQLPHLPPLSQRSSNAPASLPSQLYGSGMTSPILPSSGSISRHLPPLLPPDRHPGYDSRYQSSSTYHHAPSPATQQPFFPRYAAARSEPSGTPTEMRSNYFDDGASYYSSHAGSEGGRSPGLSPLPADWDSRRAMGAVGSSGGGGPSPSMSHQVPYYPGPPALYRSATDYAASTSSRYRPEMSGPLLTSDQAAVLAATQARADKQYRSPERILAYQVRVRKQRSALDVITSRLREAYEVGSYSSSSTNSDLLRRFRSIVSGTDVSSGPSTSPGESSPAAGRGSTTTTSGGSVVGRASSSSSSSTGGPPQEARKRNSHRQRAREAEVRNLITLQECCLLFTSYDSYQRGQNTQPRRVFHWRDEAMQGDDTEDRKRKRPVEGEYASTSSQSTPTGATGSASAVSASEAFNAADEAAWRDFAYLLQREEEQWSLLVSAEKRLASGVGTSEIHISAVKDCLAVVEEWYGRGRGEGRGSGISSGR